MELKLPALWGYYNRPTDKQNNRLADRPTHRPGHREVKLTRRAAKRNSSVVDSLLIDLR